MKKKTKTYPYIAYFLVKYEKRNITYDEIYGRCLSETMCYYNKFGKEGFLSEKMLREDVEKIAKRNAKREFSQNQLCTGSIETIAITKEDEKEVKSIIENRKDFIRWIEENEKISLSM